MRTALLALCFAAAHAASAPAFELDGVVTGGGRAILQVTLFAVDEPYTASTETSFGEFRFRDLKPGNYTVSVLKKGLGATRRTVVISPGLADAKGVIHCTLAYAPSEAAGVGGGTVSKTLLAVPPAAKNKAAAAQGRLQKRDVDGAQRLLHQAVEIAPRFTQAWNALGIIAYQTHDLPGAEKYFQAALEGEPNAFEPAANLAGVLLSEGRFEDSLAMSRRALAQRPADALANVQAGIAWFALRDYDRAETALLQTLRVDPSNFSKPQLFLADIYLHRGEPEAALAALQDYVARHPDADDVDRQRRRIEQLEDLLAP